MPSRSISRVGTAVINKPTARQNCCVVRVRLDEADLPGRLQSFHPTLGMPADVHIETGERTFFEYIMDSFSHAFKEN